MQREIREHRQSDREPVRDRQSKLARHAIRQHPLPQRVGDDPDERKRRDVDEKEKEYLEIQRASAEREDIDLVQHERDQNADAIGENDRPAVGHERVEREPAEPMAHQRDTADEKKARELHRNIERNDAMNGRSHRESPILAAISFPSRTLSEMPRSSG